MGFFITLAVRLVLLAAMWSAWGWGAALAAFLLLAVTGVPKTVWGSIDYSSPRVYIRMAIEIGVTIFGLIAANSTWGIIWAATLLILYVIGMVAY